MTMQEIIASSSEMLTADDVATAIKVAPQGLRQQAKTDPSKLGFPVCVIGTRVLIPRVSFLRWFGIET